MNVPKRPNVLWIGDEIADGLRSAVEALGLTVILTNVEGAEPERQNPHAVVMPFDGVTEEKFRGRLAHLLIRSLDSGALVTVLAQPHTDYEVASKLAMERVQVEDAHATDLRDVYPNFHVIHPDVRELARLLRDHNPGLAADQHLVLQDHEGSTTPAEKLLLRRAFSGFDRIVLKPLSGGRSPDSKVWRVEAHAGERCCEPFVAKCARRLTLVEELNTWREHVLNYIPFPFRAPPVPERFVTGATRALLVSMLASRAHRFDEYVATVKGPELAIAALFDGALRNWRRQSRPVRLQLGQVYTWEADQAERTREADRRSGRLSRAVLPSRSSLTDAFELAKKRQSDVANPDVLWAMLAALPELEYHECRMHGDLNPRNLFVRWNGVDIILIDFSHAGDWAPMSRDPSRLEVSTAFDVFVKINGEKQFLSDDILNRFYRPPLLPPRIPASEDGRLEAVRQLRLLAGGEGIKNAEYATTTACHLLKYARAGSRTASEVSEGEARRLRGLSYLLSAKLIQWLREGNNARGGD
ncbi:MAG TPA: phosphotransferase [Tepidisphaeraceae bacterium]